MSWVKRTDQFSNHPNLIRAGKDAYVVHSCALEYVMGLDNETGGHVMRRVALTLGAAYVDDVPTAIRALVEHGIWGETDDGYRLIHGMDDQRRHETILRERELTRVRNERYRESKLSAREKANGVSDGVSPPSGVSDAVTNATQPSPAQPSPKRKRRALGGPGPSADAPGARPSDVTDSSRSARVIVEGW